MKRTRRVEVIRYRRRSALIQDEGDLGFRLPAEEEAMDALLKVYHMIESSEKSIDTEREVAHSNDPCAIQKRSPASILRLLTRLRTALTRTNF